MAKSTGKVNIHGKQYETVALRVQTFREQVETSDHSIITEVLHRDSESVVMKASIIDPDGRTIATGHAEEKRAASQINRTSALENCETSAIGRALAAFGLAGEEFASANEVLNAKHQQKQPQAAADKVMEAMTAPDPLDPLKEELVDVMKQAGFTTDQIRAAIGKLSTEDDFKNAITKTKEKIKEG